MCNAAICEDDERNYTDSVTTVLYDMEPLGKGGERIESITSYIARLALAHRVKVSDLLNRLILPAANKNNLAQKCGTKIFDSSFNVNGMSDLSETIIITIQRLTGRTDLVDLSFIKLREMFSSVNLIRKNMAWCPNCLDNMRLAGNDIYYPLIWNMKSVEICTLHKQPLEYECRHCGRNIPVLTRLQVNGFCPHCRKWLGNTPLRLNKTCTRKYRYQEWKADEVSKILTHMQGKTPLDSCCMKRNIDTIYRSNKERRRGNRNLRLFNYWRQPDNLPQLETVLELCFNAGLSVYELCFADMDAHIVPEAISREDTQSENKNVRRKNHNHKHLISCALNFYLSERYSGPPLSLKQIACKIGFNPCTIQQYWPELSAELSAKYMASVQASKKKRVDLICGEVNRVFWGLMENGIEPTLERVKTQLPSNYFCHDGVGYKAWLTERDKRNGCLPTGAAIEPCSSLTR